MKLSKLFHTLYATVMALPVLIIPIFALNIIHKETEPISIEVQEKVSVNFNQLFVDDYNFNATNWTKNNCTLTYDTDFTMQPITSGTVMSTYSQQFITYEGNHIYYLKVNIKVNLQPTNYREQIFMSTPLNGTEPRVTIANEYITLRMRASRGNTYRGTYPQLYVYEAQEGLIVNFNNFQVYDLTKMFGSGNEPTIEEFDSMFIDYYPYTESEKMLVNKPSPTTYNNTDIGSQFVYALYKPVHDYFNFGEFFGLGGMYDWFQLNIFNGTSPISFFIVFNVMIYWLFISLFWLLFDILIYVPMVIHKWLDKAEM